MAYACNCPSGHHDGRFYRLCVGRESTSNDIVFCPPITTGPVTVSCEAVPVPIVPDPRDARIAELEAKLSAATTLSDDVAEAAVAAIDYSKRLDAALAEVARLEALILQINDDLGRTWDTGLVEAAAAAIRSRGPGVECPTRGKKE